MSKRMLHENITKSTKFSKISFEAECLYNRLLTQTDDYGNTLGSSGYIKDLCFPRTKNNKIITYQQVKKWIKELLDIGLIILYKVDEVSYLHFFRFEDFQTLRKDRIKNSSIPYYEPLRSNGCQVVAESPHEVEVKVEVKEEVKYKSFSDSKLNCLKITEKEYSKLVKEYSISDVDSYLKKLSLYVGSKGKKYKSHYMTILNWLDMNNIKTTRYGYPLVWTIN